MNNQKRCNYCMKFITNEHNCKSKNLYKNKLEIINLYLTKKFSTRKIADFFDSNKSSINRFLKKNKTPIRTKTEGTPYEKKYFINKDIFKKIDTKEKAYWLGFIYADGCIVKNRLSIVLNKKDKVILEKFKLFIGYTGEIKNYKEFCSIYIFDEELKDDLKNLGVVERKSNVITFPKINKFLVKHFILGYFDGDGWYCVKEKQWGICSGSKEFLLSILDFLQNYGFKKNKIRKQNNSNTYLIQYSGNTGQSIRNFIFDETLQLNRKAQPLVSRITNVIPR